MSAEDSGVIRARLDREGRGQTAARARSADAGSSQGGAQRADALPKFSAAQFDRRLFDASPLATWIVDDDTLAFLESNHAATQLFGWTREEFLGLTLRDLRASGDFPLRSLLVSGAQAEASRHVPWRPRTKRGETRVVEVVRRDIQWEGRRAGLITAIDTTESTRIAQTERNSGTLFRGLAEHLDHVVWVGEIDENRVIYINEACERVFGWSADHFYADSHFYRKLAHPDDLHELERMLAEMREKGRANAEYRIVRPDGSVRWVHTEAYIVSDEEGRPLRHSGYTRDITVRREAEINTQKLNTELERRVQQRTAELVALNRELETFSYSVSHDLKEPVRAIEGLTSILIADHAAAMSPDARSLLLRLQTGAVRMRCLIDGLLSLSRVERKPMELVDVDMQRKARDVAASLIAETNGRRVQLTIGELPNCRGDETLLRVVLTNLLSNALKFTRDRELARIEIGWNGNAYFVRDNGVGLEMRHAERVFAPFERLHAHDRYEGSGIGLATVRRIVERHHGRVWVESVPGEGSTFFFEVKVAAA